MKLIIIVLLIFISTAFLQSQDQPKAKPRVNYPIRISFINRMQYWYGDKIAQGWGVPGFAPPHTYNYLVMAFWGCAGNPKDVAQVWANAGTYFGDQSSFGKTTQQIQKSIKKIYNDHNISLMVSAFGDSQFPTSAGQNAVECGKKFGKFIVENNFDGGDVDWQDNAAMEKGLGQQWLIQFTKAAKEIATTHIFTHAPQAPYFKNDYYKNGGYITVNKEVGDLIDWYNIQFFNQVDSRYDTYQQLFVHASGSKFNGTSIRQIVKRGVSQKKLLVLKPATPSDATNTGYMDRNALGSAITKAYEEFKYFTGTGFWQYYNDRTGEIIKAAAGHLVELCAENKNCK